MHNLKDIRNNLELFKKKFKDRNIEFNTNKFTKLDDINRELIQKKELLEQEKKSLSKSKDKQNFEKSKNITKQINEISLKQEQSQKNLDNTLKTLSSKELELDSLRNTDLAQVNQQLNQQLNQVSLQKDFIEVQFE